MFDLYNEKRAKNFPWEARDDRKEEKMKQHDNTVYYPQSNLNETCTQKIIIEYLEEKEMIRVEIPGLLPAKWHEEAYDLERKLTVNISDFVQDMLLCKGYYVTFPDAVVAFIHHYDGRKESLTVFDYLKRSGYVRHKLLVK